MTTEKERVLTLIREAAEKAQLSFDVTNAAIEAYCAVVDTPVVGPALGIAAASAVLKWAEERELEKAMKTEPGEKIVPPRDFAFEALSRRIFEPYVLKPGETIESIREGRQWTPVPDDGKPIPLVFDDSRPVENFTVTVDLAAPGADRSARSWKCGLCGTYNPASEEDECEECRAKREES